MDSRASFFLKISGLFFVCSIILLALGMFTALPYRVGLLALACAAAFAVTGYKGCRGYTYTAWVMVCVGGGFSFPQFLMEWHSFPLPLLIVPLTQLCMFGMGATLSLDDFRRILVSPWPIFIGAMLQFTVMPFVGFLVVMMFGFEGELAAGIILIGSVSGGLASNVI